MGCILKHPSLNGFQDAKQRISREFYNKCAIKTILSNFEFYLTYQTVVLQPKNGE
jgi:hypothetical protein